MADQNYEEASLPIQVIGSDQTTVADVDDTSGKNRLRTAASVTDNVSMVHTVLTVSTTPIEAKVGGSALAGRQKLIIFNDSNIVVRFGGASVSTSGANKGIPIQPGELLELEVGDQVPIYLIVQNGNRDCIIMETS